jgi:hypothetical protein
VAEWRKRFSEHGLAGRRLVVSVDVFGVLVEEIKAGGFDRP